MENRLKESAKQLAQAEMSSHIVQLTAKQEKRISNEQIDKLRAVTGLLKAMASERNSRNIQELIKLLESGL